MILSLIILVLGAVLMSASALFGHELVKTRLSHYGAAALMCFIGFWVVTALAEFNPVREMFGMSFVVTASAIVAAVALFMKISLTHNLAPEDTPHEA